MVAGMPSVSTLGLFALAAIALLLVPGPSVLYVITRSVDQGRKAGLVSVLGLHTASIIHVTAAATGLSAVLLASATAFQLVKLAGAAYLVVLGVNKLLGRGAHERVGLAPASLRRIYGQGFVVNLLNPKTALFFVAFLPQFVKPERGPVAVQVCVLGLLFITLGLLSDSTYAVVAGTLAPRLRRRRADAVSRPERATGLVYIGLGIVAATTARPAVATH
jgi:threonine/homoserine/homoserine lactone efflux protein